MKLAVRVSALFSVLLGGLGTAVVPAWAEGLIDNVNGITVDETGSLVHFTGLVLDDDGRVQKRLMRGEKRPERPSFRYDGKGRTLIPGMIDAHARIIDLGFSKLNLDLSNATSLDDARQKIAAFAAENPGRPWIIGYGWDHEKWGMDRFPTAADLAGLADGRPIWLERIDGHAGWANDAALTTVKITASTKAPQGGRIDLKSGKPTGILVGTATTLVTDALPRPLPKDYDAAFAIAQDVLIANGVTAVTDMGTTIEAWQAYRRAGDRGALRIRILGYARGMEQASLIAGPRPTPWLYDDRLRLGGVKLTLDGALGSRGAWLKVPYSDAPTESGLALLSSTQLRNQMSRAAMDGFQLAVHAVGDQANADALDAIEELAYTYKGDRRWRIEHAQIIDPADLPRLAGNGIIASMQPDHASSDWAMATKRLGQQRLGGAYAWRSMLDAKVKIAFGSAAPIALPDPFTGLKSAISRTNALDKPIGAGQPEQRVTMSEALRAYGWAAAYAGFAEKKFGNLEPGQRADFLILDKDIELARPADLPETNILEVWIAGQRTSMKESAP